MSKKPDKPTTLPAPLPTYPFQHESFWLDLDAAAPAQREDTDAAFWASVEDNGLEALTRDLDLDLDDGAQALLSTLVPALSAWRHSHGWWRRIMRVPVPTPALSTAGTGGSAAPWLLLAQAGSRDAGLFEALSALPGLLGVVEDAAALADALRAAPQCASILALPEGLAWDAVMAALDGAGSAATLWILTQRPAAPHSNADPASTEDPAATDKPAANAVLAATDKPTAGAIPAATDKPADTENAAATNKRTADAVPTATDEPNATDTPATTDKPSARTAPTTVDQPAATGEPASIAVPTAPDDPTTTDHRVLAARLRQAHPTRRIGTVESPRDLDPRSAALLTQILSGDGDGVRDQRTGATSPAADLDPVIRGGGISALRSHRADLNRREPGSPAPWAPSGSVLVTLGETDAGYQVARWLARSSAPHVILVCGSANPARVRVLEDELDALGAAVTVESCDPSDAGALARIVDALPDEYPLTAIFHCSAGDDDADPDGPAAAAAPLLDRIATDQAVSAFVLLAPVATGRQGLPMAHPAGTDALFLALAERRRAAGLPGTAVLWPRTDVPEAEAPAGSMRYAVAYLAQAIVDSAAGFILGAVAPAADGAGARSGRPAAAAADNPAALLERLRGQSEPEQERILLELVTVTAAAVLGHRDPERLGPDADFLDIGFSSLTAVELRNRLVAATGLPLPASAVYDLATPALFATYLREELAAAPTGATPY